MDHTAFAQKMKHYTILYVEDDCAIRQYITEFLKRYCLEIYGSDSAEEGFKLYKKVQPDILLLDINLGGMSGVELAKKIRKNDKKTRILIATAYTNKEFLIESVELGLTRYLVKPLINEDLVKALEKCWSEIEEDVSIELSEGFFYSRNKALLISEDIQTPLRHKEVDILEYFIENEGQMVRYEQLEESIWREEIMSRDAIRSQIRNIRKKLKVDLFENVSGLGYKFSRKT